MQTPSLDSLYDKERKYYALERPEMLQYFPASGKTMLDIGCGEGLFGKTVMDKYRAEVWGIDFDQLSIDIAQKILTKAFCGDIHQLQEHVPDRYFDAIYFNDVLEHLVDPYTLLEQVRSKLTAKGVVVASIPNLRYFRVLAQILFKKDFKYEKKGVMDETHMRFFTQKSIARMFVEAGYTIQHLEPMNRSSSFKPRLAQLLTLGIAGSDIAYTQIAVVASK